MTLDTSLRIAALVTVTLLPANAAAQCLVSEADIVSGAARDAIPALTNPETISAAEADLLLAPTDTVLGVVQNGEARAYPMRVLWWHEIVNDVLGGVPIAVSYCPLTGSSLVYDPVLDGQHMIFGTSGLLFDNNLIMYDRTSLSLWSQMMVSGICGSYISHRPSLYPVTETTWAGWKAMHPDTTAISFDTGYSRDSDRYPYGDYDTVSSTRLLFPHSFMDDRLPLKALVHGIAHDGTARAYPLDDLTASESRVALNDQINGRALLVVVDRVRGMVVSFDRRVRFRNKKGKWKTKKFFFDVVDGEGFPFLLKDRQTGSTWNLQGVPVGGELVDNVEDGGLPRIADAYNAFWFGWASFNRDTQIYEQ